MVAQLTGVSESILSTLIIGLLNYLQNRELNIPCKLKNYHNIYILIHVKYKLIKTKQKLMFSSLFFFVH